MSKSDQLEEISGKLDTIDDFSGQISDLDTNLDGLDAKLDNLDSLDARLDNIETQVTGLHRMLRALISVHPEKAKIEEHIEQERETAKTPNDLTGI
jgi:hypothetical protein